MDAIASPRGEVLASRLGASLAVTSLSSRDERYSVRQVEQSLGLSRTVIDSLVEAGFVTPARGPRNQRRFDFQDLMLLRTAHDLRRARVSPRRIVEALAKLRSALPEGAALTSVRVSALGSRVIVRDRQGTREAASGQFVMDFDEATPASSEADAPAAGAAAPRPSATVLDLARADARRAGEALRRTSGVDARTPSAITPMTPTSPTSATSAPDATTAYERGTAAESLDPAAAEAAYRRALELEPTHVQAAINLAAMLCDQGRAAHADAVCVAVLALGNDDALLRFNHALALDDLKRPRAALAAYQRAIELDPTFADAHYNAAALLESLHDARGALRHFAAYRKLQGV